MIEINNLTADPINEEFLKGVAKKVLGGENKAENNLSIALVGQGRIRELNKKYRKKNKVTDVLTFGEGLNEIVICLREVKKNAKGFKSTFKKELARVLIHGILHLLGYNHEKDVKEAEKMEEKQNHYLSRI
ncbi:rRNA maturation RNase YbeY [Patescibacteria group bacterium]|nr:rRNA maturation RNase YbeY [Patescibacteria group bacterium]